MVAREIVSAFVNRRSELNSRRPVVVYYITNGLRVAHQNSGRLVAGLRKTTEHDLVSPAERLSLILKTPRLRGPVELFALTPATSFPGDAMPSTEGRVDERVFLLGIMRRALPDVARAIPVKLLRRRAGDATWQKACARIAPQVATLPESLLQTFRKAMRDEFGHSLRNIGTVIEQTSPRMLLTQLRRALSHAALLHHPPDLVILDEFQKYRHMVTKQGCNDRLISALYNGQNGKPPAVLLLSGTPYPSAGDDARQQLFDLLAFLKGDEKFSKDLAAQFRDFGELLQAIAQAASETRHQAELAAKASVLRDAIQRMMTTVMARTERHTLDAPVSDFKTPHCTAPLSEADLKVYRGLIDQFLPKDGGDALAYWLSVPLPAQALGARYQAWKRRNRVALTGPKLNAGAVARLEQPSAWPHPKLRALHQIASPASLALPWIAPTLRWWDLHGAWKKQAPEKLLVFSRFKATPQSIAALTSYTVDATELRAAHSNYRHGRQATRLQPGKPQMPLFALFHPSPFLATVSDPLAAGVPCSLDKIRRKLRAQIVLALSGKNVELPHKRTRARRSTHRPVWKVLAAIERLLEHTQLVRNGWKDIAQRDMSARTMRDAWLAVEPLEALSAPELDDLVEMALSAPGVLCARALRRHYPDALSSTELPKLTALTWSGLRVYLDEPVFWAKWKKRAMVDSIHKLMVDGCFESVLDEHFWMRSSTIDGGAPELAKDLAKTFQLSAGSFTFQVLERNGKRADKGIRISCHAAVPFGGTDDQDYSKLVRKPSQSDRAPARSDELRTAFNTPFWPHVLASTSVGQEGLDFHTWCSRVAHWDLCPTPVELEQREGRVTRYGGLAVRRVLAAKLCAEAFRADAHTPTL
ncbi:Helicase [Cupriavidus taiwanensis]|uniref:Helicase n=2 Tax=Cupriavidus taiwanensis TaxID=164546 RepID=A0A375IH17_9BURK|nr:Helicase [Cupriavidus taiwanensis]